MIDVKFWLSYSKIIWRRGSSNAGTLGNTNTPSLPLLAGPLWLQEGVAHSVQSMDQIKENVCKQRNDVKL